MIVAGERPFLFCMHRLRLILLFLSVSFFVYAQNDSLPKKEPATAPRGVSSARPDSTILHLSTTEEQRFSIKNSNQRNDTVLDNLHNYYQMGVLGNIGLPSYSLLVGGTPNTDNGFFKWVNLNNQNDLFTSKQPVYFYPKGKVYTKIFAAMGQKQEQVFKILHSQNIGRVNISLQFNRYSCIGFYQNQKSLTDNLLFSSHARSKNGRVGYNFYFILNKLKYQINGGIDTSRVNFEKNVLVEKQLFPVRLSTAKQNLRTLEANFNAFLKLSKDSVGALHFVEYQTNYRGNYWLYSDGPSDSAFFTHNYFTTNSGTNKDSVSFQQWSNSFLYTLRIRQPNGNDNTVVYAGYKNEFNHYHQFSIDTLNMNHIAVAGAKIIFPGHNFIANAQYVMSGFNKTNYQWNAQYYSDPDRLFYVSLRTDESKLKPALMNSSYYSTHFAWKDTLTDVTTANGNIEVASRKFKFALGAVFQSLQNMIYFDTLALPRQYLTTAYLTRYYLQKDLKIGHIHFNNTLNYQTTKNPDVIRLPQYYTFHQLYYEGKLFKKALWLQFGVQARYISAFTANAYMPATNQFFLQNQKEYGNYVFVDVFLNAQIDRFRFFLLASHINQGLSGANYMLTPNYAMPDRSLKAGLCWMFFD